MIQKKMQVYKGLITYHTSIDQKEIGETHKGQ